QDRRGAAFLPDEPRPVRGGGVGDDRLRVRGADHQGAAARVRRRVEPADPAPDGGLGRMTQTVSEPAWLAGQRAAARERYEALPVPTNREEAWRYTNLRGFDPDTFDPQPSGLSLSDAELPEGVVFGSLAALAAERPELVEAHYGTVVPADEKFAAG